MTQLCDNMIPGEYFHADKSILANEGQKTVQVNVASTGDRPIQVGSHTHFFEVNKALKGKKHMVFI